MDIKSYFSILNSSTTLTNITLYNVDILFNGIYKYEELSSVKN